MISEMKEEVVNYLTSLPEISLYLAVSQEDTLRIIQSMELDAAIFCRNYWGKDSFIQSLCLDYPALDIFLYRSDNSVLSAVELMDVRKSRSIRLDQGLSVSLSKSVNHNLEQKQDINYQI